VISEHWSAIVHSENFLSQHASLMISTHNVELYRLLASGEAPDVPTAANLVQNGGFETGPQGQCSGWTKGGSPTLVESPWPSSKKGNVARLSSADAFFQEVDLESPGLYRFRAWTSTAPGVTNAQPKLQLIWKDRDGRDMDGASVIIDTGPKPQQISLAASIPKGAVRVSLCIAAFQGLALMGDAEFSLLKATAPGPANSAPRD
jgi:hypothetical protein